MALDVSHDKALRGLPAMELLVRGVVGAGLHDESECIEWKGPIDLSKKADCFLIAKAILGLANRDPTRAARFFEGYGYVVAGVEPGSLHGVATDDPADFATRVSGHVGGAGGPAWTPVFIAVDGVDVLVVTVEPPRPGDRIWPLRREFSLTGSPARRGTIYVRKPGKSEPADDADVDMLQDRLLASAGLGAELRVQVVSEPLRWLDQEAIEAEARANAASVAARAVEEAENVQRHRDNAGDPVPRNTVTGIAGINLDALRQLRSHGSATLRAAGFGFTPDSRSLDEFREQVESWRAQWVGAVIAGAEQLAAACNPVVLRVSNPTDLYLPDVEVEVLFDFDDGRGFEELDIPHLPDIPHPFGQGIAVSSALLSRLTSPAPFDPYVPQLRRTWVRDGSVIIGQGCGELRPQSADEGDAEDAVFVLLTALPPGGMLNGSWSATVRDRDGVIRGMIDLAVRAERLTLDELLAVLDVGE